MNANPRYVDRLISVDASITPDVAISLEHALGVPVQFWLNLEVIYIKKAIPLCPKKERRIPCLNSL